MRFLFTHQKQNIMKQVIIAFCGILALAAFTPKQNISGNKDEVKIFEANSGTPLSAYLVGANEAPVMGDPDGEGWAELSLNQGQGTITFMRHVEGGIVPATASHIHRSVAGVPGPVVVALVPSTSGMSTGVAIASKELIKEIRENPENFYVNVHNSVYPAGALRGQLSK